MNGLKNKTVLVTGGSKGIGFGIAKVLMREGMRVAITSRDHKRVEQATTNLSISEEGEVLGIVADVVDYESQQKAVNEVVEKWGKLDVLVANAGVGNFAPITELTLEQWHETIDTNLTGVFYSVKASLQALKKSKGYIFTISSLAGANFFPTGSAYNASKFGLTGFTQAMMLDLRQDDIKVSTIMPGSVATHFNSHIPSEKDAWKIQSEDIGELVLDLLKMNPRTLPSKVEVRPSKPPMK